MSDTIPDLDQLLISGSDERIKLSRSLNVNRYFLNPLKYKGLLNRGSCTSCTLNEDTYRHLNSIDLSTFEAGFQNVVRKHASQIKELLSMEKGAEFDVFFAPSGSDLAYYPLLFQTILHPDAELINIITCPEELGSGTQIAAEGRYYGLYNQFEEKIEQGGLLSPEILPRLIKLSARNKEGHINDNRTRFKEIVHELRNKPLIGNLVYGSKSGIEDNLHVIDDLQGENILWTVDLCQFRNSKILINRLLEKNCLIFLTGSKFYQAPPFCGCLLIPKRISDKLINRDSSAATHFSKIFSRYDIPEKFENIRNHLPDYKNLGLHLRWECALYEMYRFDSIDEKITYTLIEQWNQCITERLSASPYFELMPDMQLTNNSIISFRVKVKDEFLGHEELWKLFQKIVTSRYDGINQFNRIFIGQPVKYGNNSFLRLAIGAHDIRSILESGSQHPLDADLQLIAKIEEEIQICFPS